MAMDGPVPQKDHPEENLQMTQIEWDGQIEPDTPPRQVERLKLPRSGNPFLNQASVPISHSEAVGFAP